ncbi:MAG: TRAP transporter small permease subunit, partial [Paracoccaceae bacterium]|nr:TRAP transporter small permease subunit [Paracoccaceae bacterium]
MAKEPDPDDLIVGDELIAEGRSGIAGETPKDMPEWMRKIVATIDITNNWVGRFTCLLLVPIIFAMVYEVVARKLFIAPTIWAYDTSRMFSGALFMLGAGYVLMRGVHIRADFLYRNWTKKSQATVDASLYLLFYFPAMLFFFWVSLDYTISAWVKWERTMDTTLMAPLAPARTAMPVGAFFLLLQGVAEILRAFHDMGPERASKYYKSLPVYIIGLLCIFLSAFFPAIMPLGDWWSSLVDSIGLTSIPTEFV